MRAARARRRLSYSPRSSLWSPICSTRFQLRFVDEAALEQSVSAAPIGLRIRLRKQDHPFQQFWRTKGEAVEEPEIWQGELSSQLPRIRVRYTSFSTNTFKEINLSQSEFLLYLNSRASWSDGTKRIYCINTCMNKIKMKITLTPPHSIRQPLQMTRNTDLMLQLPTIMIREGI